MTDNRAYYDAFAQRYDDGRDRGYHRLIDDQAAALVRRVGEGRDVLEVGCGTGLVLQRVARFARSAQGIDLSPGMLAHARARGLDVREGSATALPLPDESVDVAYSFKVLSHVPELERALAEMLRVVRPGGHLVFDVYNRHSLRYLIKRAFGPRATSQQFDEAAISTAFLTPDEVVRKLPPGGRLVARAGIRVLVPHPAVFAVPGVGAAVRALEWSLMDSPAARFAGFAVYTVEKTR
ncbi:MAG: methyltransferase domain-containing protein [Nannocystaceae bacterium]|nr:methyltransferase domain-containing protein [Nannocystaceae bacterium]